jgi:hypothetical protein
MAFFLTLPEVIEFDLQIEGGGPGVNAYSARGLRGRLQPIDEARGLNKLPRSVNGGIVDISAPQFRKYHLDVYGSDGEPPAIDNLWVGQICTVSVLTELAYPAVGGTASRPAVIGSGRVSGDGNYLIYRPLLIMLLVDWDIERDAWNALASWKLEMTEA